VRGGFLRLLGKTVSAMLLHTAVYLLRDGNIDTSEMPLFYPDTPLKETDGIDRSGQVYRTVQRADSSLDEQPEEIAATVLCLLVGAGVSGLGNVRHFIVLGGLSSPPGAYERVGVLSALIDFHPGWSQMEEQELLIF
jgi:hypothetical protein